MLVLGIETSNVILSVAIVEDNQTLIEITEHSKNNHSERLMPVIEKAFKEINRKIKEIDLIAVSEGPGSYTGVRIGVTVAKTLAWTLDKPLVGLSSLEILAKNLDKDGIVIPLFDARRQTAFAGAYKNGQSIIPDGHYVLDSFLNQLSEIDENLYFVGEDVDNFWEIITEVLPFKTQKIEDPQQNIPHAATLAKLAIQKKPIPNIHNFTPKYHRLPEAEVNWLASLKENSNVN